MPSNLIRVMISSRCNDSFPQSGPPLTELRRRIKQELERQTLFGERLFEVWINEDAPPADTSRDSVAFCLSQVDEADLVLVLSNGNAGWASTSADVGICHAELMRGVSSAPGKVRLISLGSFPGTMSDADQAVRNTRFQEYLSTQGFFRGGTVTNADEAMQRVHEALVDGLKSLVRLGVREARKGVYHTGEALEWSTLSFQARQAKMVDVLSDAFAERPNGIRNDNRVTLDVDGQPLLFVIHAIPSALTVPNAREMVGRPFLRDFLLACELNRVAGPVHVIGCQRSATETQAASLLGFPDATIIRAPFGIYVADPVQKVQFVYLRDCRDRTTTRFSAQRFFDWLAQSSEDRALVARAHSRARIVQSIAAENG